MRLAPCLLLLLAAPSWADGQGDLPPSQALGLVKAAALKGQGAPSGTRRLIKAVEQAQADASAQPPDKREAAVERHVPEINAAAGVSEDRPLNNALARFNNSAGHYEDAARFADRALRAHPKDTEALVSRSAANVGLNRFDDAYADADAAVKLEPDDSSAYRARALAAYKLRRFVHAQEDARRAVALDPNDRAAYYIMQLAGAKVPALNLDKFQSQIAGDVQREYHGMIQQLNQVDERVREPSPAPSPQAVEGHLRGAAGKIRLRDYAGAIADATRAVAADPQNASAYYYRAAAQNLAGLYAEAVEDATRALMLDPTDVRARDVRAWAYNNIGRFRDAIADSNHSLEINPANAYAYWNLGYAREHVGDLAGMAHALKTAAALSPQFEPAYRDAAARHGLTPRPLQRAEPRDRDSQRAHRRSFLIVVLSSVVGGLLIAAGFIQLYGDPRAPAAAPPFAKLNAAYVLGRPLGKGGMGVVYEAFDRALRRTVAVKVMRPETLQEPGARERFLEEARTVAGLHHPAIVDIHAIVEDKDGLCLVFEHIDGRTLDLVLAERGRLTLAQARSLLKPVCQALEYAHACGVVHRDLKPANIMVTSLGQVKIMDFGISRHERRGRASLSAAERASARGTPTYMAPEQECGEVRRESDVFSLGACLYEMVTGRRPFRDDYALDDKLAQRFEAPTSLVPGLPRELDALVARALQPDPHERLRSPGEFLAALERLAA